MSNQLPSNILTCSSTHGAAVGSLGELFVWGRNQSGQLGFKVSEVEEIMTPSYIRLQHEFFKIKATQVVSGDDFTVVLTQNLQIEEVEDLGLEPLNTQTDFTQEDEENFSVQQSNTLPYEFQQFENEVLFYLRNTLTEQKVNLISIFRRPKIRLSTFHSVIQNYFSSRLPMEFTEQYTRLRKMLLPGHKVNLSVLYNLVFGRSDNDQMVYILGNQSIIPHVETTRATEYFGTNIGDLCMAYFRVEHPDLIQVQKIACGTDFVLVLNGLGHVIFWANKASPVTGRKDFPQRPRFLKKNDNSQVSNIAKVKDIAAGHNHGVLIDENQFVRTWGWGSHGRLGQGTYQDSIFPKKIEFEGTNIQAVKIFSGYASTIVIDRDDKVYAFGDNSYKQLIQEDAEHYLRPIHITTNTNIYTQAAFGEQEIILLNNEGGLEQLGLRPEDSAFTGEEYTERKFTQIAGYGDLFYAITADALFMSWSTRKDETGLLLRDTKIPSSLPGEVKMLSKHFDEVREDSAQDKDNRDNRVTVVCCGEENSLILNKHGKLWVTGSSQYGQLARADIIEKSEEDKEQEYLSQEEDSDEGGQVYLQEFKQIKKLSEQLLITVKQVAMGFYHVLAIGQNGHVYGWGANEHGQLGLGFIRRRVSTPQQLPFQQHAINIACGASHSLCILDDNRLFSFGSAAHGKLGIGPVKADSIYHEPIEIEGIENAKFISAGENHSAVINEAGFLYCWGQNSMGQLGIDSSDDHWEPVQLEDAGWKNVACGYNHTIAIDSSSKIKHWGEFAAVVEPKHLNHPTTVDGIEQLRFKAIAAGNRFSVAINEKGRIFTWGYNNNGRLGNNPSTKKEFEKVEMRVPGQILGLDSMQFIQVACGNSHAAALSDKGDVMVWGFGTLGRLGIEPPDESQIVSNPEHVRGEIQYLVFDEENQNIQQNKVIEQDEGTKIYEAQQLLVSQNDDTSEDAIKATDQEILQNFTQCIEKFIEVSKGDSTEKSFFDVAERKMLARIQLKPFESKLTGGQKFDKLEMMQQGFSDMLTIFQLHPCYLFRLIKVIKDPNERKQLIKTVYKYMENDQRLINSCIYFSTMILEMELQQQQVEQEHKRPIDRSLKFFYKEDSLYRLLFTKIMKASTQDALILRNLTQEIIAYMIQSIPEDRYGITTNPKYGLQDRQNVANEISAYSINRRNVDARMAKLLDIIRHFCNLLQKVHKDQEQTQNPGILDAESQQFTYVPQILVKKFREKCSEYGFGEHFKPRAVNSASLKGVNLCLDLVFNLVSKAVKFPLKYIIAEDIDFKLHKYNLISLAVEIKAFLAGKKLGQKDHRWFEKINKFNTGTDTDVDTESMLKLKVDIYKHFIQTDVILEAETLYHIFDHSLQSHPIQITVNAAKMVNFIRYIAQNQKKIIVSSPSYDPINLIMQVRFPELPIMRRSYSDRDINLTLATRSLRRDPNIVRCKTCQMLIPRDLAPTFFETMIPIFEPTPPNSATQILDSILRDSTKFTDSLLEGISQYVQRVRTLFKDFLRADLITNMQVEIEVAYLSGVKRKDSKWKIVMEQQLRRLMEECVQKYYQRKQHIKKQEEITHSISKLQTLFESQKQVNQISNDQEELRQQVLFNVEYGAANRELEAYSDSVMFRIFMNAIKEYTQQKGMSIDLFENLRDDITKNLQPFHRASIQYLKRNKCLTSVELGNIKASRLQVTIETTVEKISFIVTYNIPSFNICGSAHNSNEIVILQQEISKDQFYTWAQQAIENQDKTFLVQGRDPPIKLRFHVLNFQKYVAKIEDEVAGYHQNVKINKEAIEYETERRDREKNKANVFSKSQQPQEAEQEASQ